ncbi:hypothetical protein F5Y05DRAFT_383308, partial [Hypoxylon sp. FL0543]
MDRHNLCCDTVGHYDQANKKESQVLIGAIDPVLFLSLGEALTPQVQSHVFSGFDVMGIRTSRHRRLGFNERSFVS